jgi:hypothetical protein
VIGGHCGVDWLGDHIRSYRGCLVGGHIQYSRFSSCLVGRCARDLWTRNTGLQSRSRSSGRRSIAHCARYISPNRLNKNNVIVIADQFVNLLSHRLNRSRSFRSRCIALSWTVVFRRLLSLCRESCLLFQRISTILIRWFRPLRSREFEEPFGRTCLLQLLFCRIGCWSDTTIAGTCGYKLVETR